MAKTPRTRGQGPRSGGKDGDGYEKNREQVDDPEEHLEIERRRFRGGLPPTPELYARAREQWKALPGALAKPPMGEGAGDPGGDQPTSSPKPPKDGHGGDR